MDYPKEIFNINENITIKNMREYERVSDKAYKDRLEKEKNMGRKMTLAERYEHNKSYGL